MASKTMVGLQLSLVPDRFFGAVKTIPARGKVIKVGLAKLNYHQRETRSSSPEPRMNELTKARPGNEN